MFILNKEKRYESKKTLFLIRGLAGSGKTTLANALSTMAPARHGKVWTVSTDDYFYQDGKYKFDQSKLKEAHQACQNETIDLMKAGVENIVVHNTFSRFWEMALYQRKASFYGYSVFVIECQNQFGSEHDVPQETIERMKQRFERA